MVVVPAFEISVLVLVQIALLLVVARFLGAVAARAGLTRVVGELATGFLLGPSILGVVFPAGQAALFSGSESSLLNVFSLVGLVLLLTLAGMEMDFELVRRNLRSVVGIGAVGLAVPFGLGTVLGFVLPTTVLTGTTPRLVFAVFLAIALSISAIPVIVRILIDLEVFERPFGQLTVATAMFTDVVGWLLLSVIVGVARTGRLDIVALAAVLATLVAFVAGAFLLGQRLLDATLARLGGGTVSGHLALLVAAAFAGGAITIALGLEPALGAFVVGLVFARSDGLAPAATKTFERVTLGLFAPLFFGVAGLRADLGLLADPTVTAIAAVTLLVATVGKLGGVFVAASWLGHRRLEAFGMGAGLNARGAIEIVIAAIGLELGILSGEMYTVILGVAVLTTAMAAPLLRVTIRRFPESTTGGRSTTTSE